MKRIVLDGKEMTSRKQAHLYIKEKMGFPEYYGCNLDALADCLSEISEKKKIVLKNFKEFEENLGAYSKGFVRVFEDMASENENIRFKCEE
jgi:ribonuclease inhibitor